MNHKFKINFILILQILFFLSFAASEDLKVGWIGAMSGPKSMPNQWIAAQIAVDDINGTGGINGKQLKLVPEDTQCNSLSAVTAIKKLIDEQNLKIIIGGHCSPESVPMASIAEAKKVLMIAAITTTPKLTDAGDYIFRLSPRNTAGADLLNKYLKEKTETRKIAVLYEQTDYAEPPAVHLSEIFKSNGPEYDTISSEGFTPGTTDFRTILTKIKSKNPDLIYIGAQGNDTVKAIVSQMKELQLNIAIAGNELTGATSLLEPELFKVYDGLVYAEPAFDIENPKTKEFIAKFEKKTGTPKLPFGIWTAEAYDAVKLTADIIKRYGTDPSILKDELYKIHDYQGVSGKIGFDKNGDGERIYNVKMFKVGKAEVVY